MAENDSTARQPVQAQVVDRSNFSVLLIMAAVAYFISPLLDGIVLASSSPT